MSLHTEELDEILANSGELREQLIEWAAHIAVEARLDELARLTDTVVDPHGDLIDLLYGRRTKDSFAWARRLETALGVRKHPRVATEVTEVTETELPEPEPELATGT